MRAGERGKLTSLVVPALVGDLMIWQRSGGPSSLKVAEMKMRLVGRGYEETHRGSRCDWLHSRQSPIQRIRDTV